ncbi:hypothetical protein HQ531_06815 [bacterium]|nr:hypothetical protein [bacterium]
MNIIKTYISILLISFLATPLMLGAAGTVKNKQPKTNNLRKMGSLGVDANQHGNRRLGVHNGNKILTRFTNYGAIADYGHSPGRYDCGIYPIGSGHSYLAEFSPLVAAETPSAVSGVPIHILSEGMPSSSIEKPPSDDYLWQFEPRLGYANANDSLIAMSDDSLSWPESWPDLPADWNNKWAGQYGQYNRADQESYFHMDDFNNDEFKHFPVLLDDIIHTGEIVQFADPDSDEYALLTDMVTSFSGYVRDVNRAAALDVREGRRPDAIRVLEDKWYEIDSLINDHQIRLKTFSNRANTSDGPIEYYIYDGFKRGIGVDVAARGYQWAHPAAEDILIFTYWIRNISSWDYEKFVFGMYGDADVGDDGDQRDDDAWFDTGNDIVYQWDHDLWTNSSEGYVPAYFGWKYLESPGNPLDDRDNDEDGMVDESQSDGIDNDGDWNPYVDDTGSDGIGPNFGEYIGPDADGTEANGIPDAGEPNFEYTDNDESDQIGLTSFTAGPWPGINLTYDATAWSQLAPGSFTDIFQTVDLTFMYGSAYFALPQMEERKFAVALIFGNDYEDILRNAETMQQIYNSDYNFAKPPNLPHMSAVPGDGRVTLYWDDKAELSVDPIYGKDFEGYRIYRATDPAFNEIWNITDTYGNQTFNKPIAQFDKADGLTGPHPHGLNGIHLDMGTDTGLRHSWTDSTVENGQTYYYAIVAYDYGFDYDFYERGISEVDLRPPITPSECTKKIEINATGDPVKFAINTVSVVPNAPAMAYIAPEILADDATTLGTGSLEVSVVDPSFIRNNDQYQITFRDWSEDGVDNDGDWRTWTDDSVLVQLSPTLGMQIPPNSDTLHINLNNVQVIQNITENTTQFIYANYIFYTTFVDTQTVPSGDSTVFQYFVDIPDTSFILFPSLGVWDGWEPLYEDLGIDGCNDEYETGNPDSPCSETTLNLGGDPNQDNWDPIFNPSGTQANAKPDLGEPNIDVNDIDELARVTTSYALENLSTGEILLSDRTNFSGEDRELVTQGFRVNVTNDETALLSAETGWMTQGLNFKILVTAEKYNTVDYKAVPFDYLLTINSSVTDTSIDNKRLAFSMHDLTNDLPVVMLAPSVSDTLIRPASIFYPTIKAGGERRVTWKLNTRSKAGDIMDIVNWDDLIICATNGDGIGVYDGQSWTSITTDVGLLSNNVRDFSFSNSGDLLVGSVNGINRHTPLGWDSYSIDMVISGNAENDKQDYVSFDKVLEDSEGILWSISAKGLLRWDWHRSSIAYIYGENKITTIDWQADTFATISGDTIITGILENESIDLLDLGNGKIVVGTKSEGLEFYEPADSSFWYVNEDNSDLPSDRILSLDLSGNELFIGTQKGLAIYNLVDSAITFSNQDSLLDKKVRDVMVDSNGLVHIATSKGYNIIDFSGDTTYTALTKHDIVAFGTNKLQVIEELADGTIWFGTENSVARNMSGIWDDWAPKPGDQFIIKVKKPFSALDILNFTTSAAMIDHAVSANLLEDIAVVPNPYVVTASWEPQHLYDTGRGIRKIDFIHLPPECTIRIYSLSGKYINTIEHSSEIWDGAESWNLLSRDGLEIAYGIYLYHIEAPGIGNHINKFAVIK